MTAELPEAFTQRAYRGRAKLIQRQASDEKVPGHEILLGFARHNPAVVSYGPAGLNASIKGIGYIPKQQYLQEYLDAYMEHINHGWRDDYSDQGLQLLVRMLYGLAVRNGLISPAWVRWSWHETTAAPTSKPTTPLPSSSTNGL